MGSPSFAIVACKFSSFNICLAPCGVFCHLSFPPFLAKFTSLSPFLNSLNRLPRLIESVPSFLNHSQQPCGLQRFFSPLGRGVNPLLPVITVPGKIQALGLVPGQSQQESPGTCLFLKKVDTLPNSVKLRVKEPKCAFCWICAAALAVDEGLCFHL